MTDPAAIPGRHPGPRSRSFIPPVKVCHLEGVCVREQAREAWVGPQADQLEADEPGADQGQPAKVIVRIIKVAALEHQDGVRAVDPEVRLTDDPRLDQRPQRRGLVTRERRECLSRRAGHFRLKGQDTHGVLRPTDGSSPIGHRC